MISWTTIKLTYNIYYLTVIKQDFSDKIIFNTKHSESYIALNWFGSMTCCDLVEKRIVTLV